MVLIVDIPTPEILTAVIVEGVIFFADNGPKTFHTNYFVIRRGWMIIGDEAKPHVTPLEINIYGNRLNK